MAKSARERKAEQRERDKKSEEERLALLLSRRITLDLYKATDAKLIETMQRLSIEEPQDLLTRLIHGAHRLDDESLAELTTL
ncbi:MULTISPECIES: hypothetical protein [unclassified Pseudomonas]|uniref:hypothetical protein n=1 Tax=unclassified Pseudomonas TaxID=196821 RepID=UPI00244B9AE1|nr:MULTISPECIES: hypothetical protein [unclassified Pseudomonas]MDG9927455.1 hypothetical protein [Pseudomonas sp. GD04042]MDH0482524.1 hypothetical protein [Pseudomonas sp. GD04015]MDH0602876.1 hypothetical protein [Pseudomonas sp. GD03869]